MTLIPPSLSQTLSSLLSSTAPVVPVRTLTNEQVAQIIHRDSNDLAAAAALLELSNRTVQFPNEE